MKEKYQLLFLKKIGSHGFVNCYAYTKNENYYDIANHLSYSDEINTDAQITAIDKAVARASNGLKDSNLWGEVIGSSLYIYPSDNIVKVGLEDTTVPIRDFKELLQEWLTFIKM